MSVQARRVRVVKAKLGNDAGLIGAAIFVRESLLKKWSPPKGYKPQGSKALKALEDGYLKRPNRHPES